MFGAAQRKQPGSTPQVNEDQRVKFQRSFSLLQLLIGETACLFLAGIVVPSLVRSAMVSKHALTAGSLHALSICGITFSYTFRNLAFAVLGGVFGAALALAIDSPETVAHATGVVRAFRPGFRKGMLHRNDRKGGYLPKREVA